MNKYTFHSGGWFYHYVETACAVGAAKEMGYAR